uniref:Uncharacterized protein n=1 Tax=Fagus sylvatica TaxID=28930 RepID=A0A2N9HR10_FAGSY
MDTEEKINQFKERYGFPKDVQIRYASSNDLALLKYRDLVLPIIALVEGGVRIPMHPFLIQFLIHFRSSPLQCVPNMFRIVMGTAFLMERLDLNLTIHDITYVYRFQSTGRNQYTLVARNSDRKLVTGLPDSSKGRDEDFLVITGNWQNPLISCPLVPGLPDKKFTAKKVKFMERKTVEHLLKRPCFIDSSRRPRSAPILLGYEPSYKSNLSEPIVKDSRQAEVTVSRPGRDQEEIIQAVPLTARRGVQIPQLVTPLIDPNFVPSTQPSEVGLPVIRFPSLFDPNPSPSEEMHVQRRSINIGSVLGTLALQPPETSPLPPPPGEAEDQQALSPSEPPKAKAPKKGKSKNGRALQKAAGHVSHKHKHRNDSKELWSCKFYVEGQHVDEDDLILKSKEVQGGQVADVVGRALLLPKDMKIWQEKRSEHMLENLKGDSILAVQGIFEACSLLLETKRLLNQSLKENDRLKDLEKTASTRIQAAESKHKSAEASLMTAECQAYYDQGFYEAANSLKSQLAEECNKYFFQGWLAALDQAGVDDASELYNLGLIHRPFKMGSPKEHGEEEAAEGPTKPQTDGVSKEPEAAKDLRNHEPDGRTSVVEIQEGKDGSDGEDTLNVVD